MSSRLALAVLLVPLLAVAAPVPKRKPKFGDFGDFTDPKTKCKAELSKDGALTITVPTDQPAVDSTESGPHRPLIAKTVEGDFTLTVRMTQSLGEKAGPASEKIREAAGSGLAIVSKADSELAASAVILRQPFGKDEWGRFQLIGWSVPKWAKGRMLSGSWTKTGRPCYLRLTRRGVAVTFEESNDGEKWQLMDDLGMKELTGPVLVGPVAFQSTDQDFTATFDEYELKHLAKDDKK